MHMMHPAAPTPAWPKLYLTSAHKGGGVRGVGGRAAAAGQQGNRAAGQDVLCESNMCDGCDAVARGE
jgi:phytoene dehydrogenase-like protein